MNAAIGMRMATAVGAVLVAGCFSSRPPNPTNWTIEAVPSLVEAAASPAFGPVRVVSVKVRSPYDSLRMAVLRPDGSLAFDAYNVFAAAPSAVLRGATADAVEASGLFAAMGTASVGSGTLEVEISRLALDCRREGKREAVVELSLVHSPDRKTSKTVRSAGRVTVSDGCYTSPFSEAFTVALVKALAKL